MKHMNIVAKCETLEQKLAWSKTMDGIVGALTFYSDRMPSELFTKLEYPYVGFSADESPVRIGAWCSVDDDDMVVSMVTMMSMLIEAINNDKRKEKKEDV